MSSLLLILLSAVLATLVMLTNAPAQQPFAGERTLYARMRAVAAASLIVIPATAILGWAAVRVLLRPLGFEYLETLVLVALTLGLLTSNAAALGVALLAAARMRTLLDAILFAFVAAGGFIMLLLAFASMHERLRGADAPPAFRDAPLALVTAGLIALGLMGFTGIVQE
jgi:electron transport complex protein RnfA